VTALDFFLGIASLVLGVFRIAGFKSKSFQAIAHLFVGLLIGMACQGWLLYPALLVVVLSVLEVVCAVTMRSKP
jgi:hypothetical protein